MYLSSANGILGCSTSNIMDFIFLHQFLIKRHMIFFRENSIIGFNVVSTLSPIIELLYFSRMSVSLEIRWGMKRGLRYGLDIQKWIS